MLEYQEAAAAVAAALADEKRSLIGDPREGDYKVSFTTDDMGEAMQHAKQLVRLGVVPTTTIRHDREFGYPFAAEVNVWDSTDQKKLLRITGETLPPARQRALKDLVLARSPVPKALLGQIAKAHRQGATTTQIAERLNTARIITGMGGKRWTAQKVRKALDQHSQQTQAKAA